MKVKRSVALATLILAAGSFYAISQQITPPNSARPAESRLGLVDDETLARMAPYRIDPKTGELRTHRGDLVNEGEANSPQRKYARAYSIWAIENPIEHQLLAKPTYPPKTDPNEPDFDMAQPHLYAEAVRARATDEQRAAQELSNLAISDPIAYMSELARRGMAAPTEQPVSTP